MSPPTVERPHAPAVKGIDRRRFLGAGMAGSVLATSAGPAAARIVSDPADTLRLYLDALIPVTDTPGALEAGVDTFFREAMTHFLSPEETSALNETLAALDAAAGPGGLSALHPSTRAEVIDLFDQEKIEAADPGYALLKRLSIHGYCTSRAGATRHLIYAPLPGSFEGCIPFELIGRQWAT